jgi:tetratricopeptide (TPR) repeat protein
VYIFPVSSLMSLSFASAFTSLIALLDQAPAAAPATTDATTAAGTSARLDDLWKRRDDAAALAEQKALVDKTLPRAGKDYGFMWRATRLYFWYSDDPDLGRDERTRLGKYAWDLGERAVALNPNDVAGHFWAMGGMGNYSLGLGVVRALAQRIEGKFRERISRAEALDPRYAYGGIPLAWGRYYAKLPWPKYDEKKARANYARAIEINPSNLRARVFLAELMLEEDQPAEAKRLLEEVLKAPVGKYDAPEEKRAKVLAARALRKANEDK